MIRISELHVPLDADGELLKAAAARLRVPDDAIKSIAVVRRGVDARRYRGAPLGFVYALDVEVPGSEARLLSRLSRDKGVSKAPPPPTPVLSHPGDASELAAERPVVVGFGPAGIFAALLLARAGCSPLVLERGPDVDSRRAAVEGFWAGGALDGESNVQFGEGGAGAFSDGKLTARGRSAVTGEILAELVRAGAPEEILTAAKPHIGTDILGEAVKNIRREIILLGGEIRFGARVTGIEADEGGIRAVITADGRREKTDAVLLGIGHSARDTAEMLASRGVCIEPKPFAIGVRIEHPQEMIDRAQYGADAGDPRLPPADYTLTFHDDATGRGVYSFCMCPGGTVVAAASEPGGVVTNGMSLHERASGVANSALVAEVRPEDFGGSVSGGVAFQREWERRAFLLAGGDFRAPVESVGDFLSGRSGSRNFLTGPTYRPGFCVKPLKECLPPFVARALQGAIPAFGRRIRGFDDAGAPLTGVETRTSSPWRITRAKESGESVSMPGLFPMGEGAGYAGGIMSAASDGIRAALAFLRKIGHNGNNDLQENENK